MRTINTSGRLTLDPERIALWHNGTWRVGLQQWVRDPFEGWTTEVVSTEPEEYPTLLAAERALRGSPRPTS